LGKRVLLLSGKIENGCFSKIVGIGFLVLQLYFLPVKEASGKLISFQ